MPISSRSDCQGPAEQSLSAKGAADEDAPKVQHRSGSRGRFAVEKMIQTVVGLAAIRAAELVGNFARRKSRPQASPRGSNATDDAAIVAADLEWPAGFFKLIERWKMGRGG
jgi:hypothetical protein